MTMFKNRCKKKRFLFELFFLKKKPFDRLFTMYIIVLNMDDYC